MQQSVATSQKTFITVPNLSAAEIVKLAKKEINLIYLAPELDTWDFIQDEQGKTYEVMKHDFGRKVSVKDVPAFFQERGFTGNTAAFIALMAREKPNGYHASIPERLWRDPESGKLHVPHFAQFGGPILGLRWTGHDWSGDDGCPGWAFVAFREVPKS